MGAFVRRVATIRGVAPRNGQQPLISALRRSAEEWVTEDWAAVSKAINERVRELGWQQRTLAEKSQVSQAIVRELQHHTVERRRSTRTLEALSTTLGLHPTHLDAVLHGRKPPHPDEPDADDANRLGSRLDALEQRLAEITDRLADIQSDLTVVADHVRSKR